MFICAKCDGEVYLEGNRLVEDITDIPPETRTPHCLINTRNHYIVKLTFSCPHCRVQYVLKAASKFTEYPDP